ncbi:hypothetical protein AB6A40_005952 [Gnathostoma spinigerum]|uniref:Aromatic-L-amino-acid decarboxylase n=1 Tax=Gnathostoma spinigerum TaxID=75299 RepID=A0ABD6EQG0_9BILA
MTELELRMTDWIAKLLRIPDFFLNDHDGPGGGIIQSTASDATLIAILAARGRAIERLKEKEQACRNTELLSPKENRHQSDIGDVILPGFHDPNYFTKLIAYCSDQAHSSVDKDAMLAGVRLRKLRTHRSGPQDNYVVRAETLQTAIKVDTENGLVPFIFVATIGTTPTCAVDPIEKLGPICNDNNIWLHVDSAYAGSFLICPEYEYLSKGLEFADSFNTNVHKALQINFDCSPMWFKDAKNAVKYFDVEPVYLKHEYQSKAVDYRHLQIALGRRFRSLKIWFVIRNIGVANLQEHLRKMCQLAEYFEDLILKSGIFELFVPRHLGLVCFRMKNSTNVMNEELNDAVNNDGRIHIVPSTAHNSYFLRFAICSTKTTREDVADSCQILEEYAKKIIEKYRKQKNS